MAEPDRFRIAVYLALALVVCVLGVRYVGAQGGGEEAAPGVGGADAAGLAADGAGVDGAGLGEDGAGGGGAETGEGDGAGASGPSGVALQEPGAGGVVIVHVAGAVRDPGVFRLPGGSRVEDAVRRAGGATSRADLTLVNLAAEAEDGRQIVVPERVRGGAGGGGSAGGAGGAGAAPGSAGGAAAPGTAGAGVPAVPLDINRATLEELQTLDGIGPALAGRIVAYRDEQGGFSDVEELAQVPGIGPKRLAALRERVRV